MKKHGFTLVELLAVITILGIILSIVIINVGEDSNKRKNLDYENIVKLIEKNTGLLVSENENLYVNVTNKLIDADDKCKIKYQMLIDNNLVDETEKNPLTGKKINPESYIIVSINSDYDLEYNFVNIDDENSNQESIDYCIYDSDKFAFSTDNEEWATSKVVSINYPAGYTNEYSLDDGKTWNTYEQPIPVNSNSTIIARITYNGNYIDSSSYKVTKIDKTAPVITDITGNPTEWSTQAIIKINGASDSESGLASSPYSFDNGATWQAESTKTYTSNKNNIIIKVKDSVGNIYTSNPINITKVDSTTPTLTMTAGTYDLINGNNVYSVKFGVSSGSVSCVNTSWNNHAVTTFKSIGVLGPNTIKCTATSNAGKKASKTASYIMQYTMNSSQLSVTGTAYKSGTSIIVPPGGTQYGPYQHTNAGCYQVIYYGKNLDLYPSGYKAYSGSAGFKLLTLNYLSSDSNYYIKIPAYYDFLETVLSNGGTYTINVNSILIRYIGVPSACPSN